MGIRPLVVAVALMLATASGPAQVAATPSPPEPPGRVLPAGRMTAPRAAHTATRLADGTVLLAGGCAVDSCELDERGATIERFDPASGAFALAGRMTTPRVGHTATPLPDGTVLFAGGWGPSGVLATAERYDPATQTVGPTAELPMARADQVAVSLGDGRVLLAGGFDGRRSIADVAIFDPVAGAFAPAAAMGSARSASVGARLPDGRVIVVGGADETGAVLASAEIYDPTAGSWSATGSLRTARHKHAAVALADGSVLVAGGSDARDFGGRLVSAERYDPATAAFVPTGPLADARYKLPTAAVALPDGSAVVGGGAARVEVYDAATDAFRPAAGSVGGALAFATATLLADGSVLLAGGYDLERGLAVSAGAWRYVPAEVTG